MDIKALNSYPDFYPCIYKLYTDTGHFYIGSSKKPKERIKKHETLLRKNKHGNKKLQEAFNSTNFSWQILQPVSSVNRLQFIEQQYLDKYYKDDKCLNVSTYAQHNPYYQGKGRPKGIPAHNKKITKVIDALNGETVTFPSIKTAINYVASLLGQKTVTVNWKGYPIHDRFYILPEGICPADRPVKRDVGLWFKPPTTKADRISIGRTNRKVVELTNTLTGEITKHQSCKRASRFIQNEIGVKVQLYKYLTRGTYKHYKLKEYGV